MCLSQLGSNRFLLLVLICPIAEQNGNKIDIDARTSDAIALGVRFKCPVYTFETILSSAGILLDDDQELEVTSTPLSEITEDEEVGFSDLSDLELEKKLEEAIADEDYELASRIRDEIKIRNEK